MNTIEIKNLNKKIKGAEVLKDINLHLEGGKVYGLKGKNGSGKTMLMRAVCGLILPTGGSITINGEQLGKQISFPRSVGILIENPSFIPGYTGLKNLSVLAAIQKRVGEDDSLWAAALTAGMGLTERTTRTPPYAILLGRIQVGTGT